MVFYLVIDIETSGQYVTHNHILAFGAVIVDVRQEKIIDSFVAYPNEGFIEWEPACKKEFWDTHPEIRDATLKELQENGELPSCAFGRFVKWVESLPNKEQTVIIVDTADFDAAWMNYHLSRIHSPSLHSILGSYKPVRDVTSFHLGVAKQTPSLGMWDADIAALRSLTGNPNADFPDWKIEHDHSPVNDASVTGLRAARIANLIESCHT